MINIFRKNKWQINYVEEAGAPKKAMIVTAKTIAQAKEQFRQFIGDKHVIVFSIMIIS